MRALKYSLYYLISAITIFLVSGCKEKTRLVTGSFSDTGLDGINVYNFYTGDGVLKWVSKADAGPNPSYFCISKKKKIIYAINEVSKYKELVAGGLTTLAYSGNFEKIKRINEMAVPNGGPCFISLLPDESYLLIASYAGGSVAVVKLDEKGIPIKVTDTIIYKGIGEKISHAHMISSDPEGARIYVTDLGLDRILIYTIDESAGKLLPFSENGAALPDGTGPRHFVFSSDGSKMYVMGELNSTISVFQVDKNIGLIPLQTISALRSGFAGKNSSADIHIGNSGKFLYGTNRGENSIVTFNILEDGKLSLAGHVDCGGNWPRNFVIDPSGKFILVGNQKSENIAVFKLDSITGIPSKLTQSLKLKAPACLKF
jgi:6-phosphogluconolactonase